MMKRHRHFVETSHPKTTQMGCLDQMLNDYARKEDILYATDAEVEEAVTAALEGIDLS